MRQALLFSWLSHSYQNSFVSINSPTCWWSPSSWTAHLQSVFIQAGWVVFCRNGSSALIFRVVPWAIWLIFKDCWHIPYANLSIFGHVPCFSIFAVWSFPILTVVFWLLLPSSFAFWFPWLECSSWCLSSFCCCLWRKWRKRRGRGGCWARVTPSFNNVYRSLL